MSNPSRPFANAHPGNAPAPQPGQPQAQGHAQHGLQQARGPQQGHSQAGYPQPQNPQSGYSQPYPQQQGYPQSPQALTFPQGTPRPMGSNVPTSLNPYGVGSGSTQSQGTPLQAIGSTPNPQLADAESGLRPSSLAQSQILREAVTQSEIATKADFVAMSLGDLATDEPESTRYLGKTLDGRYQIEKLLGEGGMGVVYAARHTLIDKRVAVKILKSEFARDKEIIDRFVLEAKTASSIGNAHIIDISDFGKLPDGSTYFVMEFLEGKSLTDAMTEKVKRPDGKTEARTVALPAKRICHIVRQICDGLGAAHERGIVHRDLKPDNVMLLDRAGGDFVKVLDFGIAKVTTSATEKLTRAGAVFGTPQYMSPEQASGSANVDHRADIYSLGVILYELAAGELPFDADNYMGILTMHMYRAPTPVRTLKKDTHCPAGLEAVIQKCLSKRPDNRYQSMADLNADLRRVEMDEVPQAVADIFKQVGDELPPDYFPGAQAPGTGKPAAGLPMWLWIAGVIGVVGLIGGGIYWRHQRDMRAASGTSAPTTATETIVAEARETAAQPSPITPPAVAPSAARDPGHPAHVTLDLTPGTATIKRDGKVVKNDFDASSGAPFSVEVSAPGYEGQTVKVDGSAEKISVQLVKIGAAPASNAPTSPKNSHQTVDPW